MADEVTAKVLGGYIGVSDRTVRDLAEREIAIRGARGSYLLEESIRSYCEHLRATASGRGGVEGVLDLTAERARLAKEQADAQSLKNEALRASLLPAEDVKAEWADIVATVDTRIMAVPQRLWERIDQLTLDESEIIADELREALSELHGATPQ